MNYADKLVRYIESGYSIDYKPDSEDFWLWLNEYEPERHGLERVYPKVRLEGWEYCRLKRSYLGVDSSIYFRYRTQYGVMHVCSRSMNYKDIFDASRVLIVFNSYAQVRGTMKDWSISDTLRQFHIWQNNNLLTN